MNKIDEYLKSTLKQKGSDFHMVSGDPPRARLHGDLQELSERPLEPDFVKVCLYEIMNESAREMFDRQDGADFAYTIADIARFRVNVFRHLGGMGAVFRAIPAYAQSLEDLGMPDVVHNMCQDQQGLILVTGKTGSGKSTTLAAMIDSINTKRRGHIITIEDPIEFVHQRKSCLISQREVGIHTPDFSSALQSALREDPDVVLVGELRDLETTSIAITAAETGMLVMGTLHTNGAAQTVDRIVNSFPVDKQGPIRTMLSTSLRGVISQQLIKRSDKPGRVAALEILINTSAVANLIRQGKIDQIGNAMQGGGASGMRTMDNALKQLVSKNLISGEEAYLRAFNKMTFQQYAPTDAGSD